MSEAAIDRRLVGLEDAAGYIGLTRRSVHRLVQRRLLTPVRLPGFRRTLFDRRDLDAFVDAARATVRQTT